MLQMKHHTIPRTHIFLLAAILWCLPAQGTVIYVDDDATGADRGTSWENAYRYLQDALADANSSEKPVEIRVAQGVYTPDRTSAVPEGTGAREATFQLINGVSLMGGYAGCGAADPNAREVEKYETILSGDLDGNDVVLDAVWRWWIQKEPSRIDNSYHVVTGSYTDSTAQLDGFTIASGVADATGSEFEKGGGMYILLGGPTVTDCTFTGNMAAVGAGMYNGNGSPVVTRCTFSRNWASVDTSGGGGGVKNYCDHCLVNDGPVFRDCVFSENYSSSGAAGMHNVGLYSETYCPLISNCTFVGNTSIDGAGMTNTSCSPLISGCTFIRNASPGWGGGGGMFNYGAWPTIMYSAFIGNTAVGKGGGMLNTGGSPVVSHTLFVGNVASIDGGGGMFNGDSPATITNCTFVGNSSWSAGGGGMHNYRQSPIVSNSILWDNVAPVGPQMSNKACEPRVGYCTIEGGLYGSGIENVLGALVVDAGGNMDADPCFADPGHWAHQNDPNLAVGANDPNRLWIAGDYHLKSQAGRWDPTGQTWTLDDVTSPCIDAGDPNSPVGDEPVPNGRRINMGRYGGTVEASKSCSP